jgi:antimicrobial peptide system SdpB family protein
MSRSLLAAVELAVLLSNPDWLLLGKTPPATSAALCTGVSRLSLWCVVGGGATAFSFARVVALVVLTATMFGLWPRWLCIPHWFIAFSIAERVTVIDGGEEVAQILTLLLIPMCLGDRRTWHWRQAREPLTPIWRGHSYGAHLLLRVQVAVVYAVAAISKLGFPSWRDGTAMRALFNDPQFGLPPSVRPAVDHILRSDLLAAAVTWGAVAAELCIGACMLAPRRRLRHLALCIGICLHVAIMLAMGLASFSLTMIALLLAVSSYTTLEAGLEDHAGEPPASAKPPHTPDPSSSTAGIAISKET